MKTTIKQKTLPDRKTSYIKNHTRNYKHKQGKCHCGWKHINSLIEEKCEWTNNFGAAAIALQIRPDVNIKKIKKGKALVCWQEANAKPKALIRATQKDIADNYWKSKKWSRNTQQILNRSNHLSDFGRGLYEKMLEAEKFKRYKLKKQLRQLEEVYG